MHFSDRAIYYYCSLCLLCLHVFVCVYTCIVEFYLPIQTFCGQFARFYCGILDMDGMAVHAVRVRAPRQWLYHVIEHMVSLFFACAI